MIALQPDRTRIFVGPPAWTRVLANPPAWTLRSLSTSVVEETRSAPFHLCQSGTNPDDTRLVEGLRMAQANDDVQNSEHFVHQPVMLDEVVELFASVPPGLVIDATVGGAGHASALLSAHGHIKLLGLDQDSNAVSAATNRLEQFGVRAAVLKTRFDQLASAAAKAFPGQPVIGVLFDLGVSSPQFDKAERGFSYRMRGPLDMRMDQRGELTAAEVVNNYELDELSDLLRRGGEEQFARRIARTIIEKRPISDTTTLADVVRGAIPAPARRKPGDPARKTFQALRLEVNDELPVLALAIEAALGLLSPGGRCVTLAYHSGEDRLVKERFTEASTGGCVCPPRLPCVCGAKPKVRWLSRGRKATAVEVQDNRRAKSARLRAVEALDQSEITSTGAKP